MRWSLSTFCRFILFLFILNIRLTVFTKTHHKPIVSFVVQKVRLYCKKKKKYKPILNAEAFVYMTIAWRYACDVSAQEITHQYTCTKRIVREYCSYDDCSTQCVYKTAECRRFVYSPYTPPPPPFGVAQIHAHETVLC